MNLKDKIRNNELTIGTWLTIPHLSIVEILATAKFDWIAIDIEHSAIGIESLMNIIAHIQAADIKALVRVSSNNEVVLKRVLDAGADGVIVPMIKSKEDAQSMINSVYYPPKGNRGVGLSRAQVYGTHFDEYQKRLSDNIIIIAQIEHIDSISNLDDILSFDEIDATLIGPYDLSASMGFPGKYEMKEVKSVIAKYELLCRQKNKPAGAHVISSDFSKTKEKMKAGYRFLAYSLDFFFLGDAAREGMSKLRNIK